MDLDDEELKATRMLNRVYNNITEEEVIEQLGILQEKIEWMIAAYKKAKEKIKQLSSVSDYETVCEENKHVNELLEIAEKRIKELINSKISVDLSYDDYIPKSLVKQKFEEIINQLMEICNNTKDVVEKEISRGIAIVVIALKNELLEKKMEENKDEH